MSHEQGFKPVIENPKPVGTLEALLEVHRDMQRGRMFIHFGDPLTERLAGFIEGYRACLREYGLPDEGYSRFCEWLWKTKQEEPMEKAPERYLFSAGGDHEQAIGTYLGRVSEFSTLQRPEQASFEGAISSLPSASAARPAPCRDTLSFLLQVRQDLLQGRLREHLGDINAERFNTFVDGYTACTADNHLKDELYTPFRDWLRDVKREFPGEGWPAKYLRDCHGDHERAILKYLDFVTEFATVYNLDRFRALTQEYRQLAVTRLKESIARRARFEALCTRGRELIGPRLEALSIKMRHWRDRFGPQVPTFDLFEALGISGKENRYSDLITWLCKPVDGRGGAFARMLLSRMHPPLFQQSEAGALRSAAREQVTLDGRIDLVLVFEQLAVAVEVKVWSIEHETPGAQPQTVSYPVALERKLQLAGRSIPVLGVLLSPAGTPPLGPNAARLSFFDLATAVLAILEQSRNAEEQAVIRLFAAHVMDIASKAIAARSFWEISQTLALPRHEWPQWVLLEAHALEQLAAALEVSTS